MVENVSSYLAYKHSTLTEWEFLHAVAQEADCLILLDINNIYVSAFNNGFDPHDYLNGFSTDRVAQFHLAGFENRGTHLLDSHSAAIHPPVWDLYTQALEKFGRIPTIIEWDNDIPPFTALQREATRAKQLMEKYAFAA